MDIGHIVKFKNTDGTLNGGTIVGFQKSQTGSDQALINTLDDKKVLVDISKLIKIKHQIRGKQSKKFLDKVRSEIELHNTGVQENPSVKRHKEELNLWVTKYNEVQDLLKEQQDKNALLVQENESLTKELSAERTNSLMLEKEIASLKEKHESKIDRDKNLSYTILGLKEAMIAGAQEKYEDQISRLLEIITDILEVGK